MKERRERRGENLRSRDRNASIHKQGMQFVQSTTQIVQFSSGNKASFFETFFFFSAIPLELEHNTKCTVIELCKITHRPLRSIRINIDNIYLQHSKAILECNHKYSRHECMYAHFECLRGYHVKTLAFVKSMTSSAVEN